MRQTLPLQAHVFSPSPRLGAKMPLRPRFYSTDDAHHYYSAPVPTIVSTPALPAMGLCLSCLPISSRHTLLRQSSLLAQVRSILARFLRKLFFELLSTRFRLREPGQKRILVLHLPAATRSVRRRTLPPLHARSSARASVTPQAKTVKKHKRGGQTRDLILAPFILLPFLFFLLLLPLLLCCLLFLHLQPCGPVVRRSWRTACQLLE